MVYTVYTNCEPSDGKFSVLPYLTDRLLVESRLDQKTPRLPRCEIIYKRLHDGRVGGQAVHRTATSQYSLAAVESPLYVRTY
jgi:hypothetical protein